MLVLAGVSDHPFRRVCTNKGADLTYVEMISATAMLYKSEKTYNMLKRHESEKVLSVQMLEGQRKTLVVLLKY